SKAIQVGFDDTKPNFSMPEKIRLGQTYLKARAALPQVRTRCGTLRFQLCFRTGTPLFAFN
ncbi:hypothetical protein R0K18_33150, partial [Pantoea sp. SIMBA_133]